MGETKEKEEEEKEGETEEDGKENDNSEKTPVAESVPQGEEIEKIDSNETAKKQGLMTDDEFQSILDGVHRREEVASDMAEGLDLASKSAWEGDHLEIATEQGSVTHRSIEGEDEKKFADERQKSETPQPEARGYEKEIEKEIEV